MKRINFFIKIKKNGFLIANHSIKDTNPLDQNEISEAKKKRLLELRMWSVIWEVIFYITQIWLILVATHSTKSSNGYFYQQTLRNIFVDRSEFQSVNIDIT